MKRLAAVLLLTASLQAATYYVSSASSTPAGNDSNNGAIGTPWLTMARAFNISGSPAITCGDTINVTADGHYVSGDATIPWLPCTTTIVVQSSKIASFWPFGWRTIPVNDCADASHCLYGKLTFTNGMTAEPERHGAYGGCTVSTAGTATVTLPFCNAPMAGLVNGSQVFWEINNSANLLALTPPPPYTIFTHYYVKNCSVSPACGTSGSSLELSLTSGGSSIVAGACTGTCIQSANVLNAGIQATTGSPNLTSLDSFIAVTNGTPVAVSAINLQAPSALPTGYFQNTQYYVQHVTGRTFQLSTDLAGSNIITPSDIGTGALLMSTTQMPHNFKFDGLEWYSPSNPAQILELGNGAETASFGTIRNFEIARSYFHGDTANCPSSGPKRGISENGRYVYIHDSWLAEFCTGEGQAIVAYGSFGPTEIDNNFLEAAAENTMSGGQGNSSGTPNQYRTFRGNYYYKPPSWKVMSNIGAASGPCWYDATDPKNIGGEWYQDTAGGPQNYRCGSGGTWVTTGASLPALFTIKNMGEHKNCSYCSYFGNIFNYSWVSGQSGQALAFHQGEDSGAGRANDHITAMNNKVQHAYQFTTEQSHCNTTTIYCAVFPTQHTVVNNLAVLDGLACGVGFTTGTNTCGANMHDANLDGYPASAGYHNHNTVVQPDGSGASPPPPGYGSTALLTSTSTGGGGCPPAFGLINGYISKNSISANDLQSDCSFTGGAAITQFFTNATFTNNAWTAAILSYSGSLGGGNTFCTAANCFARPANLAAIQFVNASAGDYHLSSSSSFSAANGSATVLSDDGTDLGADIDLVNMATSGAAAGTPPWDQQFNFRIIPGSFIVLVTYNTTTTGACTFSAYTAPDRTTAHLAFSGADSGSGNINDGPRREILITTGPSPSTHYWYKLDCGGGVVLTDPNGFWTRASGAGTYNFWETPGGGPANITHCTDKAMSIGCATQSSSLPVAIASNFYVYLRQTADTGQPSIRLAP